MSCSYKTSSFPLLVANIIVRSSRQNSLGSVSLDGRESWKSNFQLFPQIRFWIQVQQKFKVVIFWQNMNLCPKYQVFLFLSRPSGGFLQ